MAKSEIIKLRKLNYGQEGLVLDMIYKDKCLQDTFSGSRNTITRIANSAFTALIQKGKTNVGFIMLVENGRTHKYEIDMGILSQYRGKGYGSQALAQLKQIILNNPEKLDVEIQTRQVNEPAIRSIMKNGFVLCRQDEEYVYFKLPEEQKKRK
jgi:RimJ/RimL family protein N-acetyltransferase